VGGRGGPETRRIGTGTGTEIGTGSDGSGYFATKPVFCDGSVRALVDSMYVCFRPLSTRSIDVRITDSRSYHNRRVSDTSASSNAAARPNSLSQRSLLTCPEKR